MVKGRGLKEHSQGLAVVQMMKFRGPAVYIGRPGERQRWHSVSGGAHPRQARLQAKVSQEEHPNPKERKHSQWTSYPALLGSEAVFVGRLPLGPQKVKKLSWVTRCTRCSTVMRFYLLVCIDFLCIGPWGPTIQVGVKTYSHRPHLRFLEMQREWLTIPVKGGCGCPFHF